MKFRTVLVWSYLGLLTTASLAQEPSGRIDLDLMAANPAPQLVAGRVEFTTSEAVCPREFGTLLFRANGTIVILRALGTAADPFGGIERNAALDDQTYRHRNAMDTCRVDIDIAEQVRRNEVWTSVLLPRTRRPSLSAEERSEAERQYRDSHRDPVPLADWGRYVDARNARSTMGTLRQGIFTEISEGLPFDGGQPCFDAIGDYLIDQRGVEFHFVTSLPGDLNRFVMERVDIDDDHSRLYLTHGDCRLELTISASILVQNEWVPRSIAPFIKPKLTVHIGSGREDR
jgi:hypothetical protein